MDKHLSILAKQHIETRFVKIHAEKSPFLAEKLKIVVLPTLALIKNAKVDDYVVCQNYSCSQDTRNSVYMVVLLNQHVKIFLDDLILS